MKKAHQLILSGILFYCFIFAGCKKEYLSDNQQKVLFAEPTSKEVDTLLSIWSRRNLSPSAYSVIEEKKILDGKFTVKMVSFVVSGIKEYGAIIIPQTNVPVPVQLYISGFGYEITENSVNIVFDNNSTTNPRIFAVPALRGQSLTITVNGISFTSPLSEGEHSDAFDGATDDALAFLNLIQQTEVVSNVDETYIRGGSRGGTVAMLAAIRDRRIKKAVSVASPCNMIQLTKSNLSDQTYQAQFLYPLKNNILTLEQARMRLIASSPYYFAKYLPASQLHLGSKDKKVPVQQGYDMENKMREVGLGANFQLFVYNKTHDDIAVDNPEMMTRINSFLNP